jgi:Rps23 Pro-64 3,4-dihydroxylase Tpa1-like proline 4-hydroxylase
MKLSCHRVKNLSYIRIDEFFEETELTDVVQEIKDLKKLSFPASETCTASGNNRFKKTGKGLFVDKVYEKNREASSILRANRKIFNTELTSYAEQFDSFFGFIKESNFDITLLNYYTFGQEYKPHKDNSRISVVTFLRQGTFTGGGLIFPDQKHVVEAVHNRAIIFPSCAMHGALSIEGQGTRISIAQFIERKNNAS